jgi:hypothetical protein
MQWTQARLERILQMSTVSEQPHTCIHTDGDGDGDRSATHFTHHVNSHKDSFQRASGRHGVLVSRQTHAMAEWQVVLPCTSFAHHSMQGVQRVCVRL